MILPPMAIWAGRDVCRRPGETVLIFASLATITTMVALVLLLSNAVTTTALRLLDQSPGLIVRRVDAGGWRPMPLTEALPAVVAIPGVVSPRGRLRGTVSTENKPVAIVGAIDGGNAVLPNGWPFPDPGEAYVGRGINEAAPGKLLRLHGRTSSTVRVREQLPASAGMAVHDVVLLHAREARLLLGLSPGEVSDLAVDVFHDTEMAPIKAELASAFPWPVEVVTRSDMKADIARRLGARSSMALLAMIPAALALMVLIIGARNWHRPSGNNAGVLKAMGWTGPDLMRLIALKNLLVGGPAIITGLAAAYAVSFGPVGHWLCRSLFDWSGPALRLTPHGAAGAMILVVALVLVPFGAATFWNGWKTFRSDPMDSLQAGGR